MDESQHKLADVDSVVILRQILFCVMCILTLFSLQIVKYIGFLVRPVDGNGWSFHQYHMYRL
jgi:hypothetical protein